MVLMVGDRAIEVDKEGYLTALSDWDEAVAGALAEQEGVALTDAHWEVIYLLRDFYQHYKISPAMRPLVKAVRQQLGDSKGRSAYLMMMFGQSPAKCASKIAGLPRPTNCL